MTFERMGVIVETHESALGRWTFGRWLPPQPSKLSGLVERVWYFDGMMTHARERVFPDGLAELQVMLDEPHRDGDMDSLPSFPIVCMNGLRTRPSVVVAPAGRCRVLGIRFSPVGAALLLRNSMVDLLDVSIDVRDALGHAADELGERCAQAAQTSAWNASRNAVAIISAAAEWTAQRIAAGVHADALVASAIRTIRAANGAISVQHVGGTLGISRAQFAKRFRDWTGVTPKHFARIIRFNAALSLLHQSQNIASVAGELDYYDQAHMYRDFEEFAQMTPGDFVSSNRYPGSASLAES